MTEFQKQNGTSGLQVGSISPQGGIQKCMEKFLAVLMTEKGYWHYGTTPRVLDILQREVEFPVPTANSMLVEHAWFTSVGERNQSQGDKRPA